MKKLFFASALVAGLGLAASCSNDDVTTGGATAEVADNGLVPIELGVSGPSVSVQKRGIGTVGDIAGSETNLWKGEKLYLLMMERSERNVAGNADSVLWDYSEWSYVPDGQEEAVTVVNFPNVQVETPVQETSDASNELTWLAETTPKYYPNSGTHDFFAYHIDDAAIIYTAADNMVKDSVVAPEVNPTLKYVWFRIDGSQDLMAGLAQNMVGETPDMTNAGFSAQTARAGVKPNIVMQHLLTRFTFTVQGSDDTADGIEVERITVKSKTTGKMIVAYDLGKEDTTPESLISFELPDDGTAPVEELQELTLTDRTEPNTQVIAADPVIVTGTDDDEDPETPLVFEQQQMGSALMVAPGEEEYEMSITLKQVYDVMNPDYDDPVGSTTLTRMIRIPSATNADNPEFTADDVAQPGSSYAVNIKIYGMAKIEVDATLTGWNNGGVIEVDTNVDL